MNPSKTIVVLHPQAGQRLLLRSVLQDHGRSVVTDLSCSDLLTDPSGLTPAVILLDRSYVAADGVDVLTRLQQKWPDTEVVILPQALEQTETWRDSIIQILKHLDRLISMKSTTELLAASEPD